MTQRLKLQIGETVTVEDESGAPVRISGTKPLALIALVAVRPAARVDRAIIERTLWSTRSREQAGGSLRQLLNQLRKLLGKHGDVLASDRQAVWFVKDQIEVSFDPDCKSVNLLSALRVRDPAFKEWVNELRESRDKTNISSPQIEVEFPGSGVIERRIQQPDLLVISAIPAAPGPQFLRELVVSQTIRNLQETSTLQTVVLDEYAVISGTKAEYAIECRFGQDGELGFATINLKSLATGITVWNRAIQLPGKISNFSPGGATADVCHALSHEATEKILNSFANAGNGNNYRSRAEALTEIALREMFSFELERIKNAEELLRRAHELHPHPIQLAWRACANMFIYIEGGNDKLAELRNINASLTSEILDYRVDNGVALALISQSKFLLDSDLDTAEVFAQDAHAINPGNPLTLASLANVAAARNDHKLSASLLGQSLSIGRFSMQRHWWLIFLSLSLIRQGKYEQAIAPAKQALIRAGTFRAPMRHLYALYLKTGDHKNARQVLELIRGFEPDFSLEKIRQDPTYPASTIRSTELIDLRDLPDHLEVNPPEQNHSISDQDP